MHIIHRQDLTMQESWSAVEQMTASLFSAADTCDWQHVLTLAKERHQQVLDHFNCFPVGPDTASFYQERLTQLLNNERDLQQLATAARREVMREGLITNQNNRAVSAYLTN
jgi:hypothetical protein